LAGILAECSERGIVWGMYGKSPEGIVLGNARIPAQDYKSLRVAVMILCHSGWHIHTHRREKDRERFWPLILQNTVFNGRYVEP